MRYGWFAGAVLAASVLVSCGEADDPVADRPTATPTLAAPSVQHANTVTDMAGRQVGVPDTVTRVVALSPSTVEFAVALDLEVVGKPSDGDSGEAEGATPVGTTLTPDFNAVAALKPDLVLADAAFHGARQRDFDKFPYPVFVVKATSYQEVLDALTAVGEATGRQERAVGVTSDIRARVQAAVDSVAGEVSPKVLILTGSGREVYAGSDSTYLGDLVRVLGATNVLGNTPQGAPIAGFGLVEPAQVAALNPDVVLVIASGQGGLADQIKSSPVWANTTAVANGDVYELETALYLRRPGPRVAEAIEALAEMLY